VAATTPVTIEQAAALLGLSTSTVRRRIRAGLLRVEEVRRPQGVMRLVYLPDDVDPAVTQVSEVTGVAATAPVTGSHEAMIAYTQALLDPLVAALERSQATVKEQAETIGELRATLSTLTAPESPLAASGAAQSSATALGPFRASWRTSITAAVAVLAIVLVVVLLGWR
jgi:Helix-turn-helix domain